ncbi:hypothetical protein GPECTOR_85g354 [Gonium pectorale]|uniref:Uncharacterized protein n=1 Tax=Gonium pectorale TaxID=33097 RepID=A0A150G1C4_GONPE|nr:hypothetical protein GPECTOR_85g354 [Gonium pectorale]|eukprot:KXZ43624.1 hypothetical protein GPECTOR_85g354 [Gonium pectorale]
MTSSARDAATGAVSLPLCCNAAVTLGRVNLSLSPEVLLPLLRLVGHAAGAAAGARKVLAAAKAAMAAATAAAAAAAAEREAVASEGPSVQAALLLSAAAAFGDLPASGDVPRSDSRPGDALKNAPGSGRRGAGSKAALLPQEQEEVGKPAQQRKRGRGGLAAQLALRSVAVECPSGIGLSIQADVQLDPSYSTVQLPAGQRSVRTALELGVGLVSAALWPGGAGDAGAGDGRPAAVLQAPAVAAADARDVSETPQSEDRGVVKLDMFGTRGSLDIDVALAVLSAVQGMADVAVAASRERQDADAAAAAAAVVPTAAVAPTAMYPLAEGDGSAEQGRPAPRRPRRRLAPLLEIRAQVAELSVAIGASDVVTLAVTEARGSSGLRGGAAEGLAVRVNGRRLLDVEYLTAFAAEPFAALHSPQPSGAMESAFTASAAAAAADAAAGGRPPARRPGTRRGTREPDLESQTAGAATARDWSQPPPAAAGLGRFSQPQEPQGKRKHHRRHASAAASVGGCDGAIGGARAAPPRPPPPAALQPWASLGQLPAWASAGAAPEQRRAADHKIPTNGPALGTGAEAAAGAAAGAAGAAAARLVSVELSLYGATLTVAHDESAARVYVVLAPRTSRLKETLRALKSKPSSSPGADGSGAAEEAHVAAAADAAAHAATAAEGGTGPVHARDKPLVELLLDARRLSVVVEHAPLEAWLGLHGGPLRATATQRQLYDRLVSAHVKSYGARGRSTASTVVAAAASAAAATADAAAAALLVSRPSAAFSGRSSLGRLAAGGGASSLPSGEVVSVSSTDDLSSYTYGGDSSSSGSASDGEDSDADGGAAVLSRQGQFARAPDPMVAAGGGSLLSRVPGAGRAGLPAVDGLEQVDRDVAASYIAACRAVRSFAAMSTAAAGGSSPGPSRSSGATSALVGCPGGALLHLSVAEAQACVMVAPAGCARGRQVAEATIARLDSPASEGVAFERVVAVSLDVAATDLQACFAGCGGPASPSLTAGQVGLSGWIIRARQLAAPPRSSSTPWPVGRHHAAPVAVPVRFSRPNMKTYTDLRIEADGMSGAFSTALEPALAQLAKALKQRVVPPQPTALRPDGTVAPPAAAGSGQPGQGTAAPAGAGAVAASPSGLRPWDNIRYVWRGGMKVLIRGLHLVVGGPSCLELPLSASDPRVTLSAATLGVGIATGRVDVTATALAAEGLVTGPGRGPGEPLVGVPILFLPLLTAALHTAFKQRSPTPYAFPLISQLPPPGVIQEPVDVPGLMRAASWSMSLELTLGRDAAAHLHAAGAAAPLGPLGPVLPPLGGAQPSQAPQPVQHQAQGQLAAALAGTVAATTAAAAAAQRTAVATLLAGGGGEGLPRLFIGELQVQLVMGLVRGLAGTAPVTTRGAWKRRTHFDPPRPAAAHGAPGGGAGLGSLLSRVDVHLSAELFDIAHDAQDPSDPSDLVCLRARNLRYSNSFGYTQVLRTTHRSNGTVRSRMSSRPVMTALAVEAYDIRLFKPYDSGGGAGAAVGCGTAAGPSQQAAGNASGGAAAFAAPGAAGRRRANALGGRSMAGDPADVADPSAGPGFDSGLIALCDCLLLKQAAPEGPVNPQQPQSRPIRIVIQDVQVLCTTDTRDAVIATTSHIVQVGIGNEGGGAAQTGKGAAGAKRGKGATGAGGGAAPALTLAAAAPHLLRAAGADPLAEPQIDPRVIAEERALVALLKQQNEARRAEARRRRLERQSASTTSTAVTAARDADALPGSDSESEDEVLAAAAPPPDDSASEAGAPAASEAGASVTSADRGGASEGARVHQFQKQFEIEFVRVQVALLGEWGGIRGGNGSLVLAADNAVLQGGRDPAACHKVLRFDVGALQAYAARHEQQRDAAWGGAYGPASAGGAASRPASCTPLADGLMAQAQAQAQAQPGTVGGAALGGEPSVTAAPAPAGLPPRPSSSPFVPQSSAAVQGPAAAAATAGGVPSSASATDLLVAGGGSSVGASGGMGDMGVPALSLAWLRVVNGQLLPAWPGGRAEAGGAPAPVGPRVVMQKILNPFGTHLTSTRPWVAPPPADGQAAPPPPSAATAATAGAAGTGGLRLDIEVPSIEGQMEDWHFQLLLNVITETAVSPLPKVTSLTRGSGPSNVPAVESSGEVAAVVESLVELRQALRCLQAEALTLAKYLTHGPAPCREPSSASSASASAHMLGPYTDLLFRPAPAPALLAAGAGGGTGADAVGAGAAALRGGGHAVEGGERPEIKALLGPRPTGLTAAQLAALLRRNQELLLHWVREQVGGAQESCEGMAVGLVKVRSAVAARVAAAAQRKQATSVTVRLGRFCWALINKEGSPFVRAELTGLSFHHSLDKDHTGTTKVTMHGAEMRELGTAAPGQLGPLAAAAAGQPGGQGAAAPPPAAGAGAAAAAGVIAGGEAGTEAGDAGAGAGAAVGLPILSRWRPDESRSWDEDPLLRMSLVHGGVDAQFVTYEHVEVFLHPLQVRLTYDLARSLADYFEVPDDEEPSGKDGDGAAAKAKKEKPLELAAALAARDAAGGRAAAPASGAGTARSRHSRGPSWVSEDPTAAAPAPGAAAGAAAAGASPLALAQAAALSGVRYGLAFRRLPDGRSVVLVDVGGALLPVPEAAPPAATAPPSTGGSRTARGAQAAAGVVAPGETGAGGAAGSRGVGPGGAVARPRRQYRFRYVRFNRIAARLTYSGPLLSIGGGKSGGWSVVIDARVYRNVEGGLWDIPKKYKWDVIRSVIKNVAGVQAGKLKELRGGAGGGSGSAAATAAAHPGGDPELISLAGLERYLDLDPDTAFLADGSALSALTGDRAGGGGKGGGAGGGRRAAAAALLGEVGAATVQGAKRAAASFISAGGATTARLRQVVTGKHSGARATAPGGAVGTAPLGAGTVAGYGPSSGCLAAGLVYDIPEGDLDSEGRDDEEADTVTDSVRHGMSWYGSTVQGSEPESERAVEERAAAAKKRAERLAALLGSVPEPKARMSSGRAADGRTNSGKRGAGAGGGGRSRSYRI